MDASKENFKMRRKLTSLILLIICNIVLVIGTLYVTRTALYDIERSLYSQRVHFKTTVLLRMSDYYFKHTRAEERNEIELAKFLTTTTKIDNTEAQIMARYDPKNGYPFIWIGGNPYYQKYMSVGNVKNSIARAEEIGTVSPGQFTRFYNSLEHFTLPEDLAPVVITRTDGVRYLISWVIIPEPTPNGAKFVYIVFTFTSSFTFSLDAIRDNYTIVFVLAVLLAGMMLILIPSMIKKCHTL